MRYIPICMQIRLDSKSPKSIMLYWMARLKGTIFLLSLAFKFLAFGKIYPTDKEWEQAITP
jgi:hypothetical protein